MRVLFFVGNLGAGGLERFVTRSCLEATRTGLFEPAVLCLAEKRGHFLEVLESEGIPVREAPGGWNRRTSALWGLARTIRDLGPDLVHSQVNFSLVQQVLAARLAGVRAVCVTERSSYRLAGAALLRRRLQFRVVRRMGACYSGNSTAVAAHLALQLGLSESEIPVLPNGVDLIPPDPMGRAETRRRLGWTPDEVGIGYVGRLTREKGQAQFLESLSQITLAVPGVRACLVGDGPDRRRLLELTGKLGLSGRVHFAGVVKDVEDYLRAFDIVALFSSREGMPNAVLEAMAAGKAVVASSVGAIPELLEGGRAGLLVDSGSLPMSTAALASLITDEPLRARLGQAALERVDSHFGLKRTFALLIRHYEQVLASS